ncbi:MAG: hypothetical protein ACOYK9_00290 [Chlamydiia bacterium]
MAIAIKKSPSFVVEGKGFNDSLGSKCISFIDKKPRLTARIGSNYIGLLDAFDLLPKASITKDYFKNLFQAINLGLAPKDLITNSNKLFDDICQGKRGHDLLSITYTVTKNMRDTAKTFAIFGGPPEKALVKNIALAANVMGIVDAGYTYQELYYEYGDSKSRSRRKTQKYVAKVVEGLFLNTISLSLAASGVISAVIGGGLSQKVSLILAFILLNHPLIEHLKKDDGESQTYLDKKISKNR